ncbi:MAG TPA: Hsp20/alpha crystallin family protein [Anaerolineaceae bacterium]
MRDRIRLDPLADLRNYREALRQMLESRLVLPRDLMPSPMNAVVIPVDVLDNGPEIVIKASLSGPKPEDVSIRVQGDTLTIKATMNEEEDTRGAMYLTRERRATVFFRSLSLPVSVVAERAEARFKNGVLTLTLPKTDAVRPRVIQVTTE